MRALLIFWAVPLGFFWSWYFLSLNNLNFGTTFFSRDLHDLVFTIYGNILGLDPDTIPALVARACVVDTLLILAIFAFRKRANIKHWWNEKTAQRSATVDPSNLILSKAP